MGGWEDNAKAVLLLGPPVCSTCGGHSSDGWIAGGVRAKEEALLVQEPAAPEEQGRGEELLLLLLLMSLGYVS